MNKKRLQDTFFELIQIDSPSRSEAQVAAYCERTLKDLGFSVHFDQSQEVTGSDSGNLIAFLPGTSDNHLMLSAHMDCVDPCEGVVPVMVEGVIRSAGDTILGADDKAGIAAIFEAVRSIIEEDSPRPSITVLLTTCEELSLVGSGALSESLFAENVPCFVFDADGAPGTIIIGSPSHYTLGARFIGKAAHAGVEPEEGASAIQMAAAAIEAMQLGRLDEYTTANVGAIEGGREVNVVPDVCIIRGECRSLYEERAEKCRAHMSQSCEDAARRFGGEVKLSWHRDYPSILYQEHDPLVRSLVAAAEEAGLEPRFAFSGGGSDANIIKEKGARAITLGIGMVNFHSSDEHITVKDIEETAAFIKAIMEHYAQECQP